MLTYSVYEKSNMSIGDLDVGACVTDGESRDKAIAGAEAYYAQQMYDNGEYGEGERDAVLVIYNDVTGGETFEGITLTWECVKDDYDGGRFDFYSSRGVN